MILPHRGRRLYCNRAACFCQAFRCISNQVDNNLANSGGVGCNPRRVAAQRQLQAAVVGAEQTIFEDTRQTFQFSIELNPVVIRFPGVSMAHLQQQVAGTVQLIADYVQLLLDIGIFKPATQLVNVLPDDGQRVADLVHLFAQAVAGYFLIQTFVARFGRRAVCQHGR